MRNTKRRRISHKKKNKKNKRKNAKTIKHKGGGSFDISDINGIVTVLNDLLQQKCPNLEIRVGMLTDMVGKVNVYSPKNKDTLLICLYYNNDCIASIQLVKNSGYVEIRSFTNEMYSNKKYNTLLRYILVIISNKIKINEIEINKLHSSATNPISASTLMKHFDSDPLLDYDNNPDLMYFIDNIYKNARQPGDIPIVVDAFYKYTSPTSIPVEFEIVITQELVDRAFEKYNILVGKINPSEIEKQIRCP